MGVILLLTLVLIEVQQAIDSENLCHQVLISSPNMNYYKLRFIILSALWSSNVT